MNRQFRYCPTCASALVPEVHGGRMRLACSDARCDFVHWDNPTPVVGAIAERNGAVVQVRSIGWPAGWFGLITGFLEAGETPEEGVLREVQEEIGLTATTVDLVGLYPFHRMNQLLIVYHLEIPAGETWTYGQVATAAGNPKAARAAGTAVGANNLSWLIPCHRALASDGRLHNYHWGVARKRAMLTYEKVRSAI